MIKRERDGKGVFVNAHGMCGTRTFNIWAKMRARCTNPHSHNWDYYGGKGIAVCERWNTFSNFLADMGPCPGKLTIDRIDVEKGYEPGNCRWADMKQQSRNRTNNVRIEADGRLLCLSEWAEETGIGIGTLWWRYKAGWSANRILSPVKK